MTRFGLTLTALCVTASVAAESAGPVGYAALRKDRRLEAVRIQTPVTLDGALDEAAWRDAPVATSFLQNERQEGEPASERTEVRVLYDDEYLYVGVHAHDSAPGAIIVSDLWRGHQSAALSFNGRVGTGDFYDGTKQSYQFGPTVRLSSRLNSTVTWSRNVIALRSGEYTTDLI